MALADVQRARAWVDTLRTPTLRQRCLAAAQYTDRPTHRACVRLADLPPRRGRKRCLARVCAIAEALNMGYRRVVVSLFVLKISGVARSGALDQVLVDLESVKVLLAVEA
jgi:hypothetical protein